MYISRYEREFQRIINQRALPPIQWCCCRIALEGGKQFVIFGQRTESLSVMTDSIVTVIDYRDGNSNGFTLSSR